MRHPFRALLVALAALASCSQGDVAGTDAGPSPDVADDLPAPETPGPPAGLVVYDLQPASGPVAGGTEVTLQGDRFPPGLVVRFGGAAALVLLLEPPDLARVLTPPSPSGLPGPVDVTLEGGGGVPYVLPSAFRYDEDASGVDWCRLVFPPELTAAVGSPSTAVLARVRVDGLTGLDGAAPGVLGQVGFGPPGVDPSAAGWIWTDAPWRTDADSWFPGDRAADEHAARLVFPAVGLYDLAARFSIDGLAWAPCDLDGSPFEPEKVGHARIVASLEPGVAWARFVGPAALRVEQGAEPPEVLAKALVTGEGPSPPQVLAQFGRGPRGSLPEPGSWAFEEGVETAAPEAEAGEPEGCRGFTLRPSTAVEGLWSTAWRFSVDDGSTWRYGDLDGSDNAPSLEALGLLRVGRALEDCRVDVPPVLTVAAGDATPLLVAQVTAPELTDRAGAAAGILAQAGRGPLGSDPRTHPGWSWISASFAGDATDLLSDVYAASLTPSEPGDWSLSFRFTADGGDSWLSCDRTGSADGFSAVDLPHLHVVEAAAAEVSWCRLAGPLSLQVGAGHPSLPIAGHVLVEGRTGGPGPGFGVHGQLGTRPLGGEFTWHDAAYAGDVAGPTGAALAADAWAAPFVPSQAGVYETAFRFTADGGATWTACDADGSADGFEPGALGTLNVHADIVYTLEQVLLQGPLELGAVAGWHTTPVAAAVRVPGLTDQAPELAELRGALGLGAPGTLPIDAGWSWQPLAFVPGGTAPAGFHAYAGVLDTPEVGSFDVAVRFSLEAPLGWVHGDGDGSANGYAAGQAAHLTVVPPAQDLEIPWCAVVAPATLQLAVGAWSPPLRAELFVPGLTAASGWGPGVVAEVGLHDVANSSTAWFDAPWVADSGTNDAYEGRVRAEVPGDFLAVFRFSTSAGVNWTSCDANGPPYVRDDGVPVEVTP